jgi:iron complex outermembrane receptor protein
MRMTTIVAVALLDAISLAAAKQTQAAVPHLSSQFLPVQTDQGDGSKAAIADSSEGASASSEQIQLQEIIVTAQKREERLIDTPQSVSVLSADALTKDDAVQFRDFANTVPALTFTTLGAGYTQISLRGVTTGFDVGPTVGIYVDDVPYGSSTGFGDGAQQTLDVGLFDLDRIEVLRGPQGTLYGASTMGGLIKYVSKPPDTSSFSGNARAGVSGTQDGGTNYDAAAAVNVPIVTGKVAVRASGYESHDGGYIDNIALGQKDVNRSNVRGGRLDLLFTPSDALAIRITGFLQDISRDGEATATYSFSGVPLGDSLAQRRLVAEPFDQRFRLVSGAATYNLGAATLTSISSYQTLRAEFVQDLSALYVPRLASVGLRFGAVGVAEALATDKFTQEVRLASAGTNTLEWLVGGFYTRETSVRALDFVLRDVAGRPAPNKLFAVSAPSRYAEYAAFGDLTWHLTSKFDVSGGVRYARNDQTYAQNGSGPLGVTTPTLGSSEGVFTYLANTRYHFSKQATAYLRYATGYRPGGPAFVTIDATTGLPTGGQPTFQADRLKSYEAGFKAETVDRRFGLDLAGYYINWSNIQISVVRGGFGAVVNAPGGANVRGAELTLSARTTPNFTATGTFAYQDAHMSEAEADIGAAKGERLPNVPRFTTALNADYKLPIASLQSTVGGTLRYVSDRNASFDKSAGFPQYHLPKYATVDLHTGFTFRSVNLQLYVHNLLDERGQLSALTWRGEPAVGILQPRTIGISTTTQF